MGVSADYFPIFDIVSCEGERSPAEAAAGAAVALVSEATAAALWPGLDPLGQTLDITASPGGLRPTCPTWSCPRSSAWPRMWPTVLSTDGIDVSCVYFPIDAQARGHDVARANAYDDVDGLRLAVTAAVNDARDRHTIWLMSMQASC